jgi:hypothetical protein
LRRKENQFKTDNDSISSIPLNKNNFAISRLISSYLSTIQEDFTKPKIPQPNINLSGSFNGKKVCSKGASRQDKTSPKALGEDTVDLSQN